MNGAIVVFLSDGRQIDVSGKTAEEAVAEIRATIGTATILRTEHRIPTCSHCGRMGHAREACAWRFGGPNVNAISNPDGV